MDLKLTRYKQYSREDLHNLTMPSNKKFVRGAGKWGLHGIISVPENKDDFVFMVTLDGKKYHDWFVEGIEETGELSWRSQDSQDLNKPQIRKFIDQGVVRRNIYLMLRTRDEDKYTYLGKLEYVSHYTEYENPVLFKWQIIDWEIKQKLFNDIGLDLLKPGQPRGDGATPKSPKFYEKFQLVERTKPKNQKPRKKSGRGGKTDFIKKAKQTKEIGDIGEEIVVRNEKKRLLELGIQKDPIQVSKENDSLGYDIISYDENGEEIYIEVKATTGGQNVAFDISNNEVEVSAEKGNRYFIYRIYNLDKKLKAANIYKVQGSVADNFNIVPTGYKAFYKGEND